MRRAAALVLALASACRAMPPASPDAPSEEPLVDIRRVAPNVRVDMRYAGPDNFTGATLYPANLCLLRRSAAERLALVQADLEPEFGLKVLDCYRPLSIQRRLWELVPDPHYVADPRKGSRHNRGAAVDATLVDVSGSELEMPSAYDDFSERAHRDFALASPEALRNRKRLEEAMARRGFVGLPSEWWHFDAEGHERHGLLDVPLAPP